MNDEFDAEKAANEAVHTYSVDGDHEYAFVEGARWQHSQDAKLIAELRARCERLSALENECQAAKNSLREEIAALRNCLLKHSLASFLADCIRDAREGFEQPEYGADIYGVVSGPDEGSGDE